jgi:hypothetical protein
VSGVNDRFKGSGFIILEYRTAEVFVTFDILQFLILRFNRSRAGHCAGIKRQPRWAALLIDFHLFPDTRNLKPETYLRQLSAEFEMTVLCRTHIQHMRQPADIIGYKAQ